jgi:hypothetical protein
VKVEMAADLRQGVTHLYRLTNPLVAAVPMAEHVW